MQRRRALAASRHALKTLKKVSHSGRKETALESTLNSYEEIKSNGKGS